MKFTFIMNMPSKQGNSVHQIIAEHPASTLQELLDEIANTDFLMVEEFYSERKDSGEPELASQGEIGLNPLFIGKVKALRAWKPHY